MDKQSNKFKKNNISFILFMAAATQLSLPVQAEEVMSPLVVTASRVAEDPAAVSSDVTVLDREVIEQSQATSVADLLRGQVGLDVAASGGPGKTTSVFLRGSNSGHTLVLIDGVRVGSATVGAFDWGNFSTSDIERIEIVRGAQSSLYGADAMGGVIQIFTRKGSEGNRVRTNAEAGGRYGTTSGDMSITGASDGGVNYALSASGLRTRGVSMAASGVENDAHNLTTISGRVAIPVGDGELELIARGSDGKTGLDGFGPADVLNYTSTTKQRVGSVRLSYPLNDSLETTLQLSRSTDKVVGRDPVTAWNNSDFSTQIDQVTWQNHIDLETFSILLGVDMHKDSGKSSSAGLDRSMTQTAGFTSLGWHAGLADINTSVRYDRNSVSSNKTTYKVGGALHPLEGLRLSANFGTGFKAPSLNDLYFPPDGFGTVGNPNLRPETSRGWDVGLRYEFKSDALKAGLGVVRFEQKFNDLISWVFDPITFGFSPVNLNKANTRGVELSGDLAFGGMFVRANWTFLDAVDSATGDRLPRRAKDSGSFVLGGDVAGLHAEAQVDVVGPRFSTTGNLKPMAGYHKSDLRLAYTINDMWKIKGRIENVEDKTYEEVSGYGVLGRAWYAGVGATF